MDPSSGLFNPWTGQHVFHNGQFVPAHFSNRQYISPYATQQQQPQIPLTSTGLQGPLGITFVTSGPVIHEGFIPAPGNEDDDDDYERPYPTLPAGYRRSLFHRDDLGSDDEDDSDEERRLAEDEERLMRQIADREELQEEADPDFNLDEVEEVEDFEEDFVVDDDLDDDLEGAEEEEEEEEEEAHHTRTRGRGRGASRGRGQGRGRPRGRGRGGYRGLESTRRRGGSSRRHTRLTADPGPQFKVLQQQANEAFLRRDWERAIDCANKAVQMNPEIFTAHNLLSEIYLAMDEQQKALEALIVGAPTKRDKSLWFHIIDRVQEMDPNTYPLFTPENKIAIVLDCLRSILIIDANDYEARSQKLKIETELGHISRAITLCRKMLTIRPYDVDIIKQMARLGVSSRKHGKLFLKRMLHSFDTSIAYFIANDKPSDSNLDWSLLNLYLDLLDRAGDPAYSLKRLKTLARWIQGRKGETFWDKLDDDREFDIDDSPRRIAVPEFKSSTRARYGNTLPFEIRIKMGEFRLRLQPPNIDEAMNHFELLEPDDDSRGAKVMDYGDLFRDAANALQAAGYEQEALRFYEPLNRRNSDEMTVKTYVGLHSCYQNLGYTTKAEEIVPVLLDWETDSLDDLAIMAKFFEDQDMDDEANRRAEFVYLNGGRRILRDTGYLAYAELRERFMRELRRRPRRKYKPRRKTRVDSLVKNLRKLAMPPTAGQVNNEASSSAQTLGPVSTDRTLLPGPRQGLFRAKRTSEGTVFRSQPFLPAEGPSVEGTEMPVDSTEQKLSRKKLDRLTSEASEELKATRIQHREILASFDRLRGLSEAAEAGHEESIIEWISIARELLDEFFTFDLFYTAGTGKRFRPFEGYLRKTHAGELWQRSALMVLAVAANKGEDGEAGSETSDEPGVISYGFFGVDLKEWFEVMCQQAVYLARQGDSDRCFSTLDMAYQANVFYFDKDYITRLQICRLGCAVPLEDSRQASAAIRWLMRTYAYGHDPFRLYSVVNRLCSIHDGFGTNSAFKVFARYTKAMDSAIMTAEQRRKYNFDSKNDRTNRWMTDYVMNQGTDVIKEHDPMIFAVYAHILLASGSYISALAQYYRALAMMPQDPVLNLCIGVTYIQHGLKRLSENRQYQIQQGLAFVHRYYEIRTRGDVALYFSEAHFNVARVWHALGLTSLALPEYERCIELSARVRDEAKKKEQENMEIDTGPQDPDAIEDFATEAAFSIQSILAMAGDFEGARRVTEAVLVLD
ncbi:hypothetical protein BCR34DRAFT_152807 [Clohesyomyces aquaticus]|uniref:TPR-like protein n=1 Tax=Clohesyomyces aquaticus TaxID=1231657 RepID=A0A1Y1ZZZ6_9PLEO|nr:hypothetical protein BCR34DRAFT_152807 [Clohesyomyces aquaticus]